MRMLGTLDQILDRTLRWIAILCLGGLFTLLFVNVIARIFRLAGLAWFDEIVEGMFAWMVFLGAAALWRRNDHFAVDWLPLLLPGRGRWLLEKIGTALSCSFLLAMTWYGADLTLKANAMTPILKLPTALFYAAIPISGAIMLVHSLVRLVGLSQTPSPETETRE